MPTPRFPDDYDDFNNEAAELLEEQAPFDECGHNNTHLMEDGRLVKCDDCKVIFEPRA